MSKKCEQPVYNPAENHVESCTQVLHSGVCKVTKPVLLPKLATVYMSISTKLTPINPQTIPANIKAVERHSYPLFHKPYYYHYSYI